MVWVRSTNSGIETAEASAMSTLAAEIDYNRLNNLLWRYRRSLDRFEFLLEVQLGVLASGRQDWQHHMADLLEELAETIGGLDLEREVMLGGVTLSDLASAGPELWADILSEQQAHLTASAANVSRLRQRNEQAIAAGAAGLHRLIGAIAEANGAPPATGPDSYGEDGRIRYGANGALLFDGRV